jgi:hypothetical protein
VTHCLKATETQRKLYQALKAHKFDLEISRSITSGFDLEILDCRIEAAQLLVEWLSPALELDPSPFPTVQTPPPSDFLADRDQILPSASDPPKTSRR